MTKELIIIAIIILLVYYYYQNNQPNILDNSSEIKDLQRQVQHYQKLYQDRVAKDVRFKENRKDIEIQTDNIGTDNQETQTPLILKYSRTTQTDLKDNQIQTLITQ